MKKRSKEVRVNSDLHKTALNCALNAFELFDWNNTNELLIFNKTDSCRDIVTQYDLQVEKYIISELTKTDIPVLSEETKNKLPEDIRSFKELWVVDPIDGTVNFSQKLPFYAISIGLYSHPKFKVGSVIIPALEQFYYTNDSNQAFCIKKLINIRENKNIDQALLCINFGNRILTEQNNLGEVFVSLNKKSRGCLRLGSAAISLCYLADGKLDGVIGICNKLWDVAAGFAIAKAAGAQIIYQIDYKTYEITYVAAPSTLVSELKLLLIKKGALKEEQINLV